MTTRGMRLNCAVLRFGAIISVVLLLNAFVLAPLLHHHGSLHDPQACAICIVQATGSVAPPPAPALPRAAVSGLYAPVSQADAPTAEYGLVISARGPPNAQMYLI